MKLSRATILFYADEYDKEFKGKKETKIEDTVKPKIKNQTYLTSEDLIEIAKWKSPRSAWRCEDNESEFIKEVTKIAFKSTNEQVKIEVLQLLKGVRYPMASSILHFRFPNEYPIIDFRLLEILEFVKKEETIKYNFSLWEKYRKRIEEIKDRTGLDIRTIDKGYWWKHRDAGKMKRNRCN